MLNPAYHPEIPLSLFFILFFYQCQSQKIIRASLSCTGNSYSESGFRYRATVGQPSNTFQITNENSTLRQGFQQPFNFENQNAFSTVFCEFEILPNPAADNPEIYLFRPHDFSKIVIKDIHGRVCKVFNLNFGSENKVDISCLSNGIYFLTLNNNKINSCSKKLVVLK